MRLLMSYHSCIHIVLIRAFETGSWGVTWIILRIMNGDDDDVIEEDHDEDDLAMLVLIVCC